MTKTKFIWLITLPILLFECGYKPINQENKKKIYFQKITVIGEQKDAYTLKNNISLISNKNSKKKYNAKIILTKKKNSKIKDSSGRVTRYGLTYSASLDLINLKNNETIQKTFFRNIDYNVAKVHSDTIEAQKNAQETIIQRLADDIINFVNMYVRYE